MSEQEDVLEQLRARLDGLDERPVTEHVEVLSSVLDTIVEDLDELARTIPSAR